jgi:hypothetical protein
LIVVVVVIVVEGRAQGGSRIGRCFGEQLAVTTSGIREA